MRVANGVEILELSANIMGTSGLIHPTLIWDKDTVILIDAGFPGQLPQIKEAIEKAGISFSKINLIILTHHDIDHIGSVRSVLEELANNIKILAHEEEKPYINGEKCPIKVSQLEDRLSMLPDQMKLVYEKLKAGFQSSKVNVDITLTDGQELTYCGGINVIFTPGHTIGHICLYLKQNKILIAGDMLSIDGGRLVKAELSTNYDIELYEKSLQKLTNYDIEEVICYHGGLYKDNVNETIMKLSNE